MAKFPSDGTSKSKALGMITQAMDNSPSKHVSLNINVENRNIDGEVVRVFKIDNGWCCSMGDELPKEYTNATEFKKVVSEMIDGLLI